MSDTSPARERRGRWPGIVAVVVVLLLAAGGGTALYARSQLGPVSTVHEPVITIAVAQGETVPELTQTLVDDHLIKSNFWFGLYARFRGLEGHLRAGNYALDPGMAASTIVATLEGPPETPTVTVTFPEGWTAQQMADHLAAVRGLHITAAQYMAEVEHGTFHESFLSLRPGGASLEGFLFPDTYSIPVTATAHEVVQMQLEDFAAKAAPILGTGASAYANLTVASILERETRFAADEPVVAGVIHNRLSQGLALQLDSTVFYGLGITGQASLTPAQLEKDTPYNTYLHTGLPPTPISNPGVTSLAAAVHPAVTPYLYFITDCSGHAHFSTTYAGQQQAINTYLSQPCG